MMSSQKHVEEVMSWLLLTKKVFQDWFLLMQLFHIWRCNLRINSLAAVSHNNIYSKIPKAFGFGTFVRNFHSLISPRYHQSLSFALEKNFNAWAAQSKYTFITKVWVNECHNECYSRPV